MSLRFKKGDLVSHKGTGVIGAIHIAHGDHYHINWRTPYRPSSRSGATFYFEDEIHLIPPKEQESESPVVNEAWRVSADGGPGLPCGVWFSNRDFYRYKGKLPIVVEGLTNAPGSRKTYVLLHGCISCQLSRVSGLRETRWMILPP